VTQPFLPGLALAAALLVAGGAAQAQPAQQGQSMEERLRNQLRITTTQLQQAQNELATLKAGGGQRHAGAATGPADVEALKRDLEAARAELANERRAREGLRDSARQYQQQGQAVAEKAGAQIAQYRSAYDELLRMARGLEAERQRLAGEAATQKTALARCEAKNAQLYAVGQEVLHAYETVDLGTVLSARQPFAARSRVRFEEIAQQYGDKLYEGRFDVRAAGTTDSGNAGTPPADAGAKTEAAPTPPL
jgi:DNA repair exonuclease SbcCD ATPase subunit